MQGYGIRREAPKYYTTPTKLNIIELSNRITITTLNYVLTWLGFMVFNVTFKNISVISWRYVLLVEETRETTDLPQVTDKL